jgi:hypothetical protein
VVSQPICSAVCTAVRCSIQHPDVGAVEAVEACAHGRLAELTTHQNSKACCAALEQVDTCVELHQALAAQQAEHAKRQGANM